MAVMSQTQEDRCPNLSLSDLLDNETKSTLVKNGIDWAEIRYTPPADNAVMPDTDTLLSYQEGKHHLTVLNNGTIRIETSRYRRNADNRSNP